MSAEKISGSSNLETAREDSSVPATQFGKIKTLWNTHRLSRLPFREFSMIRMKLRTSEYCSKVLKGRFIL